MTNVKLVKALESVKLDQFNGTYRSPKIVNWQPGGVFISMEEGDGAGDYYGEFTESGDAYVNSKIEKVVEKCGYFCEWVNPGVIEICEDY